MSLFAKLNISQSVFLPKLPNLMSSKCITHMVYICTAYILLLLYICTCIYIIIITVVPPFFVSKIIHVYLFRGILFSFFSTSTKIFEHELFFSLEVVSSHSLDLLFKAIIFIIIIWYASASKTLKL